jgi:DNA-binding NarL/FixJ family response regulator
LYTVKNHVHNILVALGAEDRREAVRMAIGRGLLRPGINNR